MTIAFVLQSMPVLSTAAQRVLFYLWVAAVIAAICYQAWIYYGPAKVQRIVVLSLVFMFGADRLAVFFPYWYSGFGIWF